MRTILTDSALTCGSIRIEGDEAHHARNVLRVRVGDTLRLCDGMGVSALAMVTDLGRHSLDCEVAEVVQHQQDMAARLEIVVSPPKGSRFEDMLRSLCELGVGKITPLQTVRSGKMPRRDRLQRVCREALKQCQRTYLPEISEVVDISTLRSEDGDDAGGLMLLDPQGSAVTSVVTAQPPAGAQRLRLVIGPEGGLSPEEREHLIEQGAQAVCIAPHILRIETAAIAAAAIWISAWESCRSE